MSCDIVSEDVYSLLYGQMIFTTGIIKKYRPYYLGKGINRRRIGYRLLILTPHTYRRDANLVPIYVSAYGKSEAWLSYRILQKKSVPIRVVGLRKATKMYHRNDMSKMILIILAANPQPQISKVN